MIERETGLVAPDRTTTLYRMRYADNKNVIINFSNVTFVYMSHPHLWFAK